MISSAERNSIIRENILSITDQKDNGMCPPSLNAQAAIHELCRYFLGEDWYTVMPCNNEQCNTEIVYAIEREYKGDRATWKRVKKEYEVERKYRKMKEKLDK